MSRDPIDCLAGGGEAGALMRSIDWAKNPLGPVEEWPQNLRTMVSVMLASRFAMRIIWGPEYIFLYNDGYRPILGAAKHPGAMGSRTPESFREVWEIVGPMFRRVFQGEATASDDLLLPLDRNGYREECYFTLSYSPIHDDHGVGGVLGVVAETTPRVLAERRLGALRQLAANLSATRTPHEACTTAATTLAAHGTDLPFTLFYLTALDGKTAWLAGSAGLAADSPAAPASVELAGGVWPLGGAAEARGVQIVSDVAARFGELHAGPWPEPVTSAVVLPLLRPGLPAPYGFLVAGVSPRRALDDTYQGFFDLATEHVVAAIANAAAYEEQRERAEMLAELDRAKTAFFSSVSHEFRTPLTLMLGPIEDALAAPDRALDGEALASTHRNAQRLLKLVNSLLEFSRIEAGRMQARYQATDLATLTRELASAFDSLVSRAGLRFAIACHDLGEPVHVDRDLWEKIVLNLVSNAFKFTFEGEIEVSLTRDDGAAVLRVRDTGVGIAADEIPRLFQRFYRVEGARSRSHEGSGIGLALVHEFAKLHGGSLDVESALGAGTTFIVRIPLGIAHLPAGHVDASPDPSPPMMGAGPYVIEAARWLHAPIVETAPPRSDGAARILLVEDNADMRDYVRRILSERWVVETAPDGISALAMARANRPDLVLTDVMMPGLDGLGLVRELRAHPITRTVPIIVLSAIAGEAASMEGLAHGANDYLVKPFSARELLARIAAQLESSRIQRVVEQHSEIERRRLHSFLTEAPAAIAIVRGPHHVFELANARYYQVVGHREIVGKPTREALPEMAALGLVEIFDRVYQTGEPFVRDGFMSPLDRRGDGTIDEGFFNWRAQPTRDAAGTIDGVMVFAIEVTEQILAQRALERTRALEQELRHAAEAANRAKDEFLAMLGHELRNPLAPIATALHLMKLRIGDVAEKERVVIERQVHHLTRLVDDLLDVSRITRGKVELDRQPVELAVVVATAIELSSPLIEHRMQHLTVDVAGRGLTVFADHTRLAQVVSNLLTNAAKYTEPGGRIAVRGWLDDAVVVLEVRDDGIGIAPEILPSIFELFVQEHQPLDRSHGGLGLGLAIVRSLVVMHGGTVAATSPGRGRGSVFTIRLPAAAPMETAAPHAPTPPRPFPAITGRRILLVDDNEDAAELMSTTLELLGHQTCVAHDGPSALQIAPEFMPEVALLDIGLPVMDGYELARRMRELPALARIRLVALTGYGQESDRARSREAGFDAHAVKPVGIAALEALIAGLPGA